jgi:hypothetical protein
MLYGALSLLSKPFPRRTNREGRPKWCSFFIRTSLFGLHRAAQIRDLDGVDGTIGIFVGTPPRDRQRPSTRWGRQTGGLWNGGPVARLSNSQ